MTLAAVGRRSSLCRVHSCLALAPCRVHCPRLLSDRGGLVVTLEARAGISTVDRLCGVRRVSLGPGGTRHGTRTRALASRFGGLRLATGLCSAYRLCIADIASSWPPLAEEQQQVPPPQKPNEANGI